MSSYEEFPNINDDLNETTDNDSDDISDNESFNKLIINTTLNCFDILEYGNIVTINTKKYSGVFCIDDNDNNIHIQIKTTLQIFIDSLLHTIFSRNLPLIFICNTDLKFKHVIINGIKFTSKRYRQNSTSFIKCLKYISENKVVELYEYNCPRYYSLKYSTETMNRRHLNESTGEIKEFSNHITPFMCGGTRLLIEIIKRLNIGNNVQMKFVD